MQHTAQLVQRSRAHSAAHHSAPHHVGQTELRGLQGGQRRPKLLPLLDVAAGRVQAELCAPQGAGADVDAAAVERRHGDLETVALAAHHRIRRDADAVKHDRRRRLRVPPQLGLRLAKRQAGGALAGRREKRGQA